MLLLYDQREEEVPTVGVLSILVISKNDFYSYLSLYLTYTYGYIWRVARSKYEGMPVAKTKKFTRGKYGLKLRIYMTSYQMQI